MRETVVVKVNRSVHLRTKLRDIQITGPAGFVGFKTVLVALQAGYNVRAIMRKPEQANKLKSNSKIAHFVDKLEFAVVPDLTKKGVFDDLLSDAIAILHIASPTLPDLCHVSPYSVFSSRYETGQSKIDHGV